MPTGHQEANPNPIPNPNPNRKQDIKKLLKLAKDCRCIQSSFNRPNLHYSVRRMRMDQKADELIDYVKDWPKGTSGLVYCLSP